jgi:hypothetical protein
MEGIRCVVCGRKKEFESEGRFIDGTWRYDLLIPWCHGKWVCCYNCYSKLIDFVKCDQEQLQS